MWKISSSVWWMCSGGGIAEGDAVFENGDAVLVVGFGDANGDGGAEEPEGSGVDEREGGCVLDDS
jgi:hypothetical protein